MNCVPIKIYYYDLGFSYVTFLFHENRNRNYEKILENSFKNLPDTNHVRLIVLRLPLNTFLPQHIFCLNLFSVLFAVLFVTFSRKIYLLLIFKH